VFQPVFLFYMESWKISTEGSCQISSAYWRMVRSEENLPLSAVLRIAIRTHFSSSR